MVVEATESDYREMELVGDVGTKKDLQWCSGEAFRLGGLWAGGRRACVLIGNERTKKCNRWK